MLTTHTTQTTSTKRTSGKIPAQPAKNAAAAPPPRSARQKFEDAVAEYKAEIAALMPQDTGKMEAPANNRDEFNRRLNDYVEAANLTSRLEAEYKTAKKLIEDVFKDAVPESTMLMETAFSGALPYANSNRDKLLGDKKSATYGAAIFGFNLSAPSLVNKPDITDEAIIAALEKNKDTKTWVVVTKKINRPFIKSAINNNDKLREIVEAAGLELAQTETFYIKPKP
jgi:hypothetical protein